MGSKFFNEHEGFIDPDLLDDDEEEDEEEDYDGGDGESVHHVYRRKAVDPAGNDVHIEATVGHSSTFIALKLHPDGGIVTSFFLDGRDPSMVLSTLCRHLEDGRLNTIVGFVEKYGRTIKVGTMFSIKLDKYVMDIKNASN